MHRREHAVGVPVQVTRDLEQLRLGDVRAVDELVAGFAVLAPRVVLELAPDDATLRVENRQARTDFVGEAEQVQLGAELAVIAALRLLDELQVLVERLLRLPRGAVDALQAGVVLVAPPVRGRAAGQLERRNVARRRDVRAAAQITPLPFAGTGIEVVVGGELVAADLHHLGVTGLVVDEFELVRLVRELFAGFIFGLVDAPREQLAFLDDLAHPLFQRLQILRRERARRVEVVVEAVGDGRPDAELGLREHVLHRLREHVRGRMPDHAAAVVGVGGDGRHLDVALRRPGQVTQPAVGVAHDDDRVVGTPARQAGVTDRCPGGGPGSDPDRGCWGGAGGRAHR